MSIIHQRDNARRSLPHEPIRKCSPPCDIALRRLGRLRLVYGLDAVENLAKIALRDLNIIVGLQIQPKLRRRATLKYFAILTALVALGTGSTHAQQQEAVLQKLEVPRADFYVIIA